MQEARVIEQASGNGKSRTQGPEPIRTAESVEIARFDQEEQHALELAFEIATEDPTERDHLSATYTTAPARVRLAMVELLRACVALVAALVARAALSLSARRLVALSRARGGGRGAVELGLLSLQWLSESFAVRRLFGRRRLLRMLGARNRTGDDGATVSYLKLAERSYRSGQTPDGRGYALARDTPVIRVMLGVSVGGEEKPVYRIRRFAELEPGSFRELAGYCATDPGTVYRAFRLNPDMQHMLDASTGKGVSAGDEAGAGQATVHAA